MAVGPSQSQLGSLWQGNAHLMACVNVIEAVGFLTDTCNNLNNFDERTLEFSQSLTAVLPYRKS